MGAGTEQHRLGKCGAGPMSTSSTKITSPKQITPLSVSAADAARNDASEAIAPLAVSATDTAAAQPLAVGDTDAAHRLGIGRTLFRRLVNSGRAPAGIRLGGRAVWIVSELNEWLAAGAPGFDQWERIKHTNRR